MNLEDGKHWKKTMAEEMAALDKNKAWDLVQFLGGRKVIGSKWVFKKKLNVEGKVKKYKSRLVSKDYSQVQGIVFGDIFSHVAKLVCIRFILSIVASFGFEVE